MTQDECQCPPYPHFALGSFASGSATEYGAHDRWEAQHGGHANAALARLEPVHLSARQLETYRDELRRHVERKGPEALIYVAPHHLKALLDAAEKSLG